MRKMLKKVDSSLHGFLVSMVLASEALAASVVLTCFQKVFLTYYLAFLVFPNGSFYLTILSQIETKVPKLI